VAAEAVVSHREKIVRKTPHIFSSWSDRPFRFSAAAVFSFACQMCDEHVAKELPVVVTFFDVLFHYVEPLRPFFVQFVNELVVAFLQPPDGYCHE
jgi:hypothetical protein